MPKANVSARTVDDLVAEAIGLITESYLQDLPRVQSDLAKQGADAAGIEAGSTRYLGFLDTYQPTLERTIREMFDRRAKS